MVLTFTFYLFVFFFSFQNYPIFFPHSSLIYLSQLYLHISSLYIIIVYQTLSPFHFFIVCILVVLVVLVVLVILVFLIVLVVLVVFVLLVVSIVIALQGKNKPLARLVAKSKLESNKNIDIEKIMPIKRKRSSITILKFLEPAKPALSHCLPALPAHLYQLLLNALDMSSLSVYKIANYQEVCKNVDN